jgi:hypothetical protein
MSKETAAVRAGTGTILADGLRRAEMEEKLSAFIV